jgi:NAD(P)H-dependent flavin oxidoreductase YrpB (nitropropane dioxygenase family)
VDISTLIEGGFIEYCKFCGWALARAHARSGDPAMISGYLGQKDIFDQAIAAFAETYADQTERDHAALVAYIQATQASVLS